MAIDMPALRVGVFQKKNDCCYSLKTKNYSARRKR